MAIGANYPIPVLVNGFSCKNCTDVELARKHIDPAHPRSGPYGVNAKTDPSVKSAAVTFGGSLSGLNTKMGVNGAEPSSDSPSQRPGAGALRGAVSGRQLDLLA